MNHTGNCCKLKIAPRGFFYSQIVIFKLLTSPIQLPTHSLALSGKCWGRDHLQESHKGSVRAVHRHRKWSSGFVDLPELQLTGSAVWIWCRPWCTPCLLGGHGQHGAKQTARQSFQSLAACQGCVSTPILFASALCFSFSWQSHYLNGEQLQPKKNKHYLTFPGLFVIIMMLCPNWKAALCIMLPTFK